MFEGAAQAAADGAGGSAAADGLAVAFEPDFPGGVAGEVLAFGVGEQGSLVEGADVGGGVDVDDDGGVLAVGALGDFGVPAVVDEAQECVEVGGEGGADTG